MESQSPSSVAQLPSQLLEPTSATWLERLLLNLFSYSWILVPIAVIVLATRYRLCPSFLQNNALIQLFVNGYDAASSQSNSRKASLRQTGQDSESLIVDDHHHDRIKRTQRRLTHEPDQKRKDIFKFLWCFFGLMLSYLIWGILQEKIMTTKYQANISIVQSSGGAHDFNRTKTTTDSLITFHDSQFLVFINRIIAFILAIVALVYNRRPRQANGLNLSSEGKYIHYRDSEQSKPPAPLYEYVFCSLSNILSSWCQYEALKYVNFPTQVLSKTFKIVPVMIMSKILLHKKYQPVDYICALALSLGMFIFLVNQQPVVDTTAAHLPGAAGQHRDTSHGHTIRHGSKTNIGNESTLISGLFLLSLYLAFDSFTGNWQKSLFTRYQVTNWQMMAAVNFYSILLTLTSLHQLGNLEPAFRLLGASRALLFDCLLMSLMSSIGQFFVYYTINQFGPVIFTVIMTFRQLLAILISCALYNHHVTAGSSAGIVLVFAVVGFQIWHKSASSSGGRKPEASRIQFNESGSGSGSGSR